MGSSNESNVISSTPAITENVAAVIPTESPHPLANVELLPQQWVELYIEINRIVYDHKTSSIRQDGESLEYGLLLSKMRLTAYQHGMTHLRQYLKDGLSVWMREQSKLHVTDLRNLLRFIPSEIDLVEQWLKAATGKTDACDVAVMKHFIWQVKRKLYGLPVEHHMMPVLFGKSGGGKSVAVHHLLKPLESVTMLQNMTVFNDQFSRQMFNKNYVMFFDELAKSKQVDINSLKNIITTPRVEWRGIQSESINSASQNCTFIGCSNDPLRERIQDTTSARRFWQLNCADKFDWKTINELNYTLLWQAIDMNQASPLLEVLEEVQILQESELRTKDPIEEWLGFACETSVFSSQPTTSELYRNFKFWCKSLGIITTFTLQTFSRALPKKVAETAPTIKSQHVFNGTIWKNVKDSS